METIFKEKLKIREKMIDEEYCETLDKSAQLIPIYFAPVFVNLFRQKKFIKKFLILELDLDENLENQNTFYGESILFNSYGPFVVKTSVILKLDKNKIVFTFAKINNKAGGSNKLYVLALNHMAKYESKIKDNDEFNRLIKNIKYYRKLYDRGVELDKKSLLLVALTAGTFKEIYRILIKVFNGKETTEIIKRIYRISQNSQIIKSWNKYQKTLLAK